MSFDLNHPFTEALAQLLAQMGVREPDIELDESLMNADLAPLTRALARFDGHVTLGTWGS